MLDIAVTEVGLKRPRVVPVVRQGVAAGVPEHVWMRVEGKTRFSASPLDHPGEACGAEWRAALRSEHKRRLGLLLTLEPPQSPQLIPDDRMCTRRSPLDPADVQWE